MFYIVVISITLALIYGFIKEDKIIEWEDKQIDKIRKGLAK